MRQVGKITSVGLTFLSTILAGCSEAPPSSEGSIVQQSSALTTAQSVSVSQSYAHIELLTTPNSTCTVVSQGDSDPTHRLDVAADEDGVVSFFGAPASATDSERYLSLGCQDPSGAMKTVTLDLASSETFKDITPALLPAKTAATFRPALTNPENYSDLYLIQHGYGLRPDVAKQSGVYAQWLSEIAEPAKFVSPTTEVHSRYSFGTGLDPFWWTPDERSRGWTPWQDRRARSGHADDTRMSSERVQFDWS
jgi:hypothetical protein